MQVFMPKVTESHPLLRDAAVTYSDGSVIVTDLASHLSDKEILEYFAIGRRFNLGTSFPDLKEDNMQQVVSVSIPKFRVCEMVVYINDYGVNWGEKEILGIEFWKGDGYTDWRYYLKDSGNPEHYPVSERNLNKI